MMWGGGGGVFVLEPPPKTTFGALRPYFTFHSDGLFHRSYDLIAISSTDKTVKIYNLQSLDKGGRITVKPSNGNDDEVDDYDVDEDSALCKRVALFNQHNSEGGIFPEMLRGFQGCEYGEYAPLISSLFSVAR